MKAINIKGKPYVMVHERVKEFLSAKHGWRFVTDIVTINADECCMVCKVYDADDRLMATGHGYERADNGNINRTSHVENCETSAVGRALGFIGIGIDASIASAEEVMNAIQQQEDERPWLKDKQFVQACQRIENGEIDLYEKLDKEFKMKTTYREQLIALVEFQSKMQ